MEDDESDDAVCESRRPLENDRPSFQQKVAPREVDSHSSPTSTMITNVLPNEATHSSLDLFERQSLLVAFTGGFVQEIGPVYSTTGPTLEFQVTGDQNNFLDLQHMYLQLSCSIHRQDGSALRYDEDTKGISDEPKFVNNILHSLFSDCDVSANGIKISHANGLYGHKSYLETEMSHGIEAKGTWLACQGYNYERVPQTLTHADIANREEATRESAVIHLYGRLSVDFFTCDKLLLPGVPLRIRLIRAHNDFVVISEGAAKHYTIKIHDASLYARKMTVDAAVLESIERVLLNTRAMYK